MTVLSAAFEYFAQVSQQAISAQPPFRGVVNMLHFGDYILIKSEIAGQIQRRWFHKENPIYYYFLPKAVRLPIVQSLYTSGCGVTEIAEMIGLSVSTISGDVKALKRQYLDKPYLMQQIKAKDVTPQDLVLKSTINQKPRNFHPENRRWLDV